MIRLIEILIRRLLIKTALRLLADASPQRRAVLCRDIAVNRLRLSQLEG